MRLTATHINYFHICHRKLWLFANGINMEHTSDAVEDKNDSVSNPKNTFRHTKIP